MGIIEILSLIASLIAIGVFIKNSFFWLSEQLAKSIANHLNKKD